MYWLESVFTIESIDTINTLNHLYANVQGELEIRDESNPVKIKWCKTPFNELLKHSNLVMPFELYARLVGPQTIRSIAPYLSKLDRDTFEHPNKSLLTEWADHIDKLVHFEMNRRNDIGYCPKEPIPKLESVNDILLATRLAKYPTFALPLESSVITGNPQCVYLTTISLKNIDFVGLMFDMDDGLGSPWDIVDIPYFQSKHQQWKADKFQKPLSQYYPEYSEHFTSPQAVPSTEPHKSILTQVVEFFSS